MHYKTHLLLAICFLIASFTHWQTNAADKQPTLIKSPRFYLAQKGDEVHYILGTIHMVVHWRDFPENVHVAFSEADNVILEQAYHESFREALTMTYSDISAIQPKNPEFTAQYQDKLSALGLSQIAIPLIDGGSYYKIYFWPHIREYPLYSLDADLYFAAKRNEKKMWALNQGDSLLADYRTDVDSELTKIAKTGAPSGTLVGQILDANSSAQILKVGHNVLAKYRTGKFVPYPRRDAKALEQNRDWLPKIVSTFKKGKTFLAVGALHLYGPDGLLQLLRNDGYTVNRVNSNYNGTSCSDFLRSQTKDRLQNADQ